MVLTHLVRPEILLVIWTDITNSDRRLMTMHMQSLVLGFTTDWQSRFGLFMIFQRCKWWSQTLCFKRRTIYRMKVTSFSFRHDNINLIYRTCQDISLRRWTWWCFYLATYTKPCLSFSNFFFHFGAAKMEHFEATLTAGQFILILTGIMTNYATAFQISTFVFVMFLE